MDGNDIDDETISGENDVEYAEFSMAHRMPGHLSTTNNSGAISNNIGGGGGNGETNAIDMELTFLMDFDDASANSANIIHDSNNISSGHSCKFFFIYFNCK